MKTHTLESFIERYTVESSGCWNYVGHLNKAGYGKTMHHGKAVLVHRMSWMLHKGPIPDGLNALHKCDNRKCCNPDHLFLGTHQDNSNDAKSKGRLPGPKSFTHCKKGHLFTLETSMFNNRTGRKRCRICHNASKRDWERKAYHKNKTAQTI